MVLIYSSQDKGDMTVQDVSVNYSFVNSDIHVKINVKVIDVESIEHTLVFDNGSTKFTESSEIAEATSHLLTLTNAESNNLFREE